VFEVIVLGLAAGALYALASLGIVLIHRGSGVVNFAQSAFGLFGAFVYWELHVNGHGGPLSGFWPAFAAALLAPAALGFATHYLVMRPLRDSAPVTRLIATVALLVIILAGADLKFGTSNINIVPGVLPYTTVSIFGVHIGENLLILVGLSVVVTGALWAVYRFTAFGRATSAVSENRRALASLGHSPDLVAAINWAVGGALAGLAGLFLTMMLGLSPGALTALLVPSLTVAFVGKMNSFPLTLLGGLALGAAEALVARYVNLIGVESAVPFVVILVLLLVRGGRFEPRSSRVERLPFATPGRIRYGPTAALTLGVLVLAWFVFSPVWIDTLTVSVGVAIMLLSITVVTGLTGQLSLAQLTLAGIGAWAASRAMASWHLPFGLAALVGLAAALPVGIIVGFPALRARGVNVAIATLACAAAIENVIFDNTSLTGGQAGTYVKSPSIFGVNLNDVSHPASYFTFSLIVLVVAILVVANTRRGGTGRMLLAVRSNERAAASLGINVVRAKLYAFALAAVIAAAGGIVLTFRYSYIDLSTYVSAAAPNQLAEAVVGGIGLLTGGIAGSQLQQGSTGSQFIGQYIQGIVNWLPLIGGVLLLMTLLAAPDGIVKLQADQIRYVVGKLRRRKAAPTGSSPIEAPAPDSEADSATDTASDYKVSPALLRADNVSVRFGGVVALDGVSIDVQPGEVTGLIGPNGAGKTTLIEVMTGFVKPSSGNIRLGDRLLDRQPPHVRSRAGLARSFQTLELFEDMTVRENLLVASDRRSLRSSLRDLVWPAKRRLSPSARAAAAEFGLLGKLDSTPKELSYGDRRLVAIARSVGSGASVLLLDEPAAGLAGPERRELARLLRVIASNWGMAVLLVEHDVDLVMSACDRVTALDTGRVIACGTPAEVRRNQDVIRSYLGVAEGETVESAELTPSVECELVETAPPPA
jgi:ABC-type branched-subunit amino acid transport system ATPase component/branched-subunit amino acid ABC-type transport system permease component